jgi:protease I
MAKATKNSENLSGKRVAILATDGFEQSELFQPREALDKAGAKTELLSLKAGKIKGWDHTDWGKSAKVDKLVADAKVSDYDMLVLPGGVMNPDKLRGDKTAVAFVREFVNSGKPIAAICHGPWTLIDAGGLKGKRMTSWPTLKTDLTNAGAKWEDSEVVVDGNLITSRKPDDIPAFNEKISEALLQSSVSNKRVSGEKKNLRAAS